MGCFNRFGSEVVVALAYGTTYARAQDRVWGGWCPIGRPKRSGLAFAAFDEVARFDDGVATGLGLAEYGSIRRIH